MSGPTPKPDLDKKKTAKETTGATTREEQLKTSETREDVPAGQPRVNRSGGDIARGIGTKDELQQELGLEGTHTRVHKSEEQHVPKKPNEANAPNQYRNPDEKRGQRNKTDKGV